jgi:NADH:ubiquinone oxidoreductase subunit 6 (subunit J)
MVGMKLFADYLWPFEVVSIVILLAIVAAVVLTRKGMAGEK